MVSSLQRLADHAHQEECDDIGEDDRDDPARRGAAHIELQKAWA